MTKLKPCPFCGGKADFDKTTFGSYPHCVACDGCSVRTDAFSDKDTAIKAWNRRISPWISPKDKLPDHDTVVLVKSIGKNTGEHYYGVVVFSAKYKQFYRFIGIQDENITDYVIYWAEIPKSPEEDK